MAKELLVEGWRGINHSYAMVNQYQLLEFQNYGLNIHHKDASFYRTSWNSSNNFCGFDVDAVKKIEKIPQPTKGLVPDVTYRICFPYNLKLIKNGKLFVFGTSEHQVVTKEMISDGGTPLQYKKLPITIITPSNWSKVGFLNAGFSEEQVQVISHGVDLSIFKPLSQDLRNRYRGLIGADDNSFVLLSVGAMTQNKGIDILLSAYIQLKSKYPSLRLVLKDQSNLYGFSANDLVWLYCNERGLDPRSKEMAAAMGGIVFISENLDLNQLNGLYNAADCYVSPYRAEGFNLPPLEAAAAGLPVIVTKGGATDDYVQSSFALTIDSQKKSVNNEYYLEPNLDSLMEQIELLINKKNYDFNAHKAREYISRYLSWSVVSDELLRRMELN